MLGVLNFDRIGVNSYTVAAVFSKLNKISANSNEWVQDTYVVLGRKLLYS